MSFGRWFENLSLRLTGGQSARIETGTRRVVGYPVYVEPPCADPQGLEGLSDAAVGVGIAVAINPQVPLDAGLERRA
jgi:hypothetical protein